MQKKVSSPNYFPDQFVAIPISVQDHIFLWFCFMFRLFESCVINDHIEDEPGDLINIQVIINVGFLGHVNIN